MSTEAAPSAPPSPPAQRIEIVHVGGSPAAPAAPPPPPTAAPTAKMIAEAEHQAALEAQAKKSRYEGAGRVLKSLGIPRGERDAMLKSLVDDEKGFDPRDGHGYRLAKGAEVDKYKAAADEYEGHKPKLAGLAKYEAEFTAQADELYGKLPEKAKAIVDRSTPKDKAHPADRLAMIRDMAGLASAEAAPPAAPPAVVPAAPPVPPLKPATTIAEPGPTQPPAPGTADVLKQYEALKAAGKNSAAAYFRKEHSSEISRLLAEREQRSSK